MPGLIKILVFPLFPPPRQVLHLDAKVDDRKVRSPSPKTPIVYIHQAGVDPSRYMSLVLFISSTQNPNNFKAQCFTRTSALQSSGPSLSSAGVPHNIEIDMTVLISPHRIYISCHMISYHSTVTLVPAALRPLYSNPITILSCFPIDVHPPAFFGSSCGVMHLQ